MESMPNTEAVRGRSRWLRVAIAFLLGLFAALLGVYLVFYAIVDPLSIKGMFGEYGPSPWPIIILGGAFLYAALLLGKWADTQRHS